MPMPELIQVKHSSDSELIRETLDLYTKTFTDGCELTREELASGISQGRYIVLVFPNGRGNIKGFAIVGHLKSYNSVYCLLDYFAVAEPFRGNGYGGRMFTKVVQYMFKYTKYAVLLLECEQKLVSWYEKLKAKRVMDIASELVQDKSFFLMQVTKPGFSVDHASHATVVINEIRTELHGSLKSKQ
jgi:GNAT superfamily N-acetyltransferase